MSVVITWGISRLDCIPQTPEGADYVVTAYWECVGMDGNYASAVYGSCMFPVVQGPSFTPYEDLTQDQVLGWCWANGVNKDANELDVTRQIEKQMNPPFVSPPLPWAS